MKRWLMVLMAVLLVGTMIAGCGGGSSDDPPTTPPDSPARGNILLNSDFSSNSLGCWEGSSTNEPIPSLIIGAFEGYDGGCLNATVTTPTLKDIWRQTVQYKTFDLKNGRSYSLTFKGSISNTTLPEAEVDVKLYAPDGTDYSKNIVDNKEQKINVTTTIKTFNIEFADSGKWTATKDYEKIWLVFSVGGKSTAYTMHIDDIKLIEQ